MKVLVINCGSSSLKYQLIDMEGEVLLCKGLCERIGMDNSVITHKLKGGTWSVNSPFPTHAEAFAKVVEMMTTGEGKCINDVSEISAIGHRGVHGGEKFRESALVTEELIKAYEDLSPWRLCTTPQVLWVCALHSRSLAPRCPTSWCSIPLSIPPCLPRLSCMLCLTNTTRSTVSAATVSTALLTALFPALLPTIWARSPKS